MERLWAPWRMAYVGQPPSKGCIFCEKPALSDDEALIVHRSQLGFIMMNAFPYNNGHLLAAPYRHIAEPGDLEDAEALDLFKLTSLGITLLRRIAAPEGYNVGMNLGKPAGAGVAGHLHVHIVPRWNGDTNFMPVLADTRVLPEALQTVRSKLQQAVAQDSLESNGQ